MIDDVISKRRFGRLWWLLAGTILSATWIFELFGFLPAIEHFDLLILGFHGFIAVGFGLSLMLCFYWGADAQGIRGRFFVTFLFALVCLIAAASKGLIVSVALDRVSTSFEQYDMTCVKPANFCSDYIKSSDREDRSRIATALFGMTGLNIEAAKDGRDESVAPNDDAKRRWNATKAQESERQILAKRMVEFRDRALLQFAIYFCVALVTMTLGGWWFSRKRPY